MKEKATRKEMLLQVRNDYRRHGKPTSVELHWRDGMKAGISNPQVVRAIMDTITAELDRQIAEEDRKEAQQ